MQINRLLLYAMLYIGRHETENMKKAINLYMLSNVAYICAHFALLYCCHFNAKMSHFVNL